MPKRKTVIEGETETEIGTAYCIHKPVMKAEDLPLQMGNSQWIDTKTNTRYTYLVYVCDHCGALYAEKETQKAT